MIETVDVIMGVVPIVLVVAFIMLVVRMMTNERTGIVDRMKQAVGGAVMLLIALLVIFAFMGGSSPDDPDPEPSESYDVHFYVATDSVGYGDVSISVLQDVPGGTSVTVGQTISVGETGQCAATPSAPTEQYEYTFSGWTGADDASTPAPTSVTGDTHYFAHFSRTPVTPEPMDPSLFTFSVADGEATITGWAGEEPAAGYDLVIPETDGQGHPVVAVAGISGPEDPVAFPNVGTVYGSSVETLGMAAFNSCAFLTSAEFPSVTEIGMGAFNECASLTSVNFPAATSIGSYAFFMCKLLVSINFPAATTIGSAAFYDCDSLVSVNFPAATILEYTDDTAGVFQECQSLSSVNLPAVVSIGSHAFSVCTGITSVTFGPLISVNASAFDYWTFYDTDGETVLDKNVAANLADSTFEGVYNALVKVDPNRGLTAEMQQRVLELSAENSLKASMLAEIDPELAGMDGSEVARMAVEDIRALTAEDVEAMKRTIREAKSSGGE